MALSLGRVVRIGTTIRGTVTGILGCVPPVTSMNVCAPGHGRRNRSGLTGQHHCLASANTLLGSESGE